MTTEESYEYSSDEILSLRKRLQFYFPSLTSSYYRNSKFLLLKYTLQLNDSFGTSNAKHHRWYDHYLLFSGYYRVWHLKREAEIFRRLFSGWA